jgi:hypothetical protein
MKLPSAKPATNKDMAYITAQYPLSPCTVSVQEAIIWKNTNVQSRATRCWGEDTINITSYNVPTAKEDMQSGTRHYVR